MSHIILDLVEAQSGIALTFEQTDEAALVEAARAQRADAAARLGNALMMFRRVALARAGPDRGAGRQAILKAMARATSKQQNS